MCTTYIMHGRGTDAALGKDDKCQAGRSFDSVIGMVRGVEVLSTGSCSCIQLCTL